VIRLTRLVAALVLASCGNPPPATRPEAFRVPPPLRVAVQHQPLQGYRLAESFVAQGPFRDGASLRVGAIVNGLRVRPDASGLRIADTVSVPALRGGVPVPEASGGGLLFWNDAALYTADSFLGTLTPLLEIGFVPQRVSFGPSFALLRAGNGDRLAIDLRTRQRAAIAPARLADIAMTAEGRVLALLEGGACQLSLDAGKSYQPLLLPSGTRALSVRESSGELLVGLSSDQQIRVDASGNVQIEGAPRPVRARARADSLWPLAEPPLERALEFGVPIGEEFAGVAVAGSVATVNLRTGELVQVTRALVPGALSCRTLHVNGAILLACNSPKHGTLVLSEVFGERPETQMKLADGVTLDFADGVLVASARCDGQTHYGAICVRNVDGRFRDFDVSAQLAKLEQPAPRAKPGADATLYPPPIVRWVPKVGGGAVAVVGGSMPGLLDAESGKWLPISPDALLSAGNGRRTPEVWLGLDWIALPDGSLRGWTANGGVSITGDGRLEPSVYFFSQVAGAGAHALASDGRRVFQSLDWGRSWVETLAPPGFAAGGKANGRLRCSAVGCLLGPWLRAGWVAETPAAPGRTQKIAAAPPRVKREALPVLSCKQLTAPVVAEQPAEAIDSLAGMRFGMTQPRRGEEQSYDGSFAWATVHPVSGTGEPLGLRASLRLRVPAAGAEAPPANWPGYASLARIAFVPAFEPSARIQTASISLRRLFDAAHGAGVGLPSFQAEEADALSSLPVLGRNAGEAEGLVLNDQVPLWVRGAGTAEVVTARVAAGEPSWTSAVQSGPNQLALLSADSDGSLEVFEFAAGRARRLFQIPGLDAGLLSSNPDALAIGAQGALAILRTPSGSEPPTSSDPALLFHEDGTVSELAPWSRLFLADAPECKPAAGDYRALLQTSRAWLQLIDAAQPMNDDARVHGMFAIVRGNAERLCLEAVELADEPVERANATYQTRLSARFVGRGRGAARLGLDAGFEFRQPLSCALSSAH
jgi:hypothetical protein